MNQSPQYYTGGRWRRLAEIVLLASVYFGTGRLSQWLSIPPGNITPVWLPSGIILAAVLTCGYRVWPGIFLGAFAGNLWAYFEPTSAGTMLRCLFAGTANGLGDTLGAVGGAYLIRRSTGGRNPIHRAVDLVKLMGYGGGFSAGISALFGVSSLCLTGLLPWSQAGFSLATWWIGDAMGVLLLTPLLLAWAGGWRGCRLGREELAAIVALAVLGLFLAPQSELALMFAALPLLLWAVCRFDPRVAFTLITSLAALAILAHVFGQSPFFGDHPTASLLYLQLFLGILTAPLLVLRRALAARKTLVSGDPPSLTSLFISVISLLMAAIITCGYLYYRGYEREFRDEVHQKLEVIAQLKVSELVQFRMERMGDGLLLTRNPALSHLVRRFLASTPDAEAQQQLQAWFAKYRWNDQYDEVFLVDAQGAVRLSASEATVTVSAAIAARLPEALRSDQPFFQDFYRYEKNQLIYLSLLVPVRDETDGDRPLGVIVLRINPEIYLYPFIKRWPAPSPTGEIVLSRREGDDTMFLNELRFRTNTALSLRLPLSRPEILAVQAALGKRGLIEGMDYRGVPVLGAMLAVPDSPWFLVAKMDRAEAYGPMWQQLGKIEFVIGLLLALTVGGAAAMWRHQRTQFYQERIKQTEAQLASEFRYHGLFESVKDGILILDAESGIIVDVNPFLIEMLGYSHEVFLGKKVWELGFIKDIIANQVKFAELQQHEYRHYEDQALEASDGRRIRVEFVSNIYWVNRQKVVQCSIRDITARKVAEEALAQSEKRFRTIFEEAPMGVARIDSRTGRICEANPKFAEIAGRTCAEMAAIDWMSITHPDDVQEDLDQMARLNVGEIQGFDMNKRYRRPDGSYVWIHMTIAPLTVADRTQPQHLCMIEDISERKVAEEALQASEARYRMLAENIPLRLFIKDQNCRFVSVNKNFARDMGISPEAAVGKTVADFFPKKLAEKYQADDLRVMETGRVEELEEPYFQNGQELWVHSFKTPVWDAGGAVIGVCGIFQDITARKQATAEILRLNAELEQRVRDRTAQLEASNRELEAFSYSVSHDLRAPLRAIHGFAGILQDDYAPHFEAEGRRVLNVIRAEAVRMGRLIDALLSFSRLNRQPLQQEMVSPARLIRQAREQLATAQAGRRVDFTVGELPDSLGDPALLLQVWVNLLSNALKYTGPRAVAEIVVGGRQVDAEVVYFVKDNGVGFDMKYADKLFKVFQRLHTGAEFEGTGVGLALVQRIVHRHGGRVWAEGKVNEGATFYFSLPSPKGTA